MFISRLFIFPPRPVPKLGCYATGFREISQENHCSPQRTTNLERTSCRLSVATNDSRQLVTYKISCVASESRARIAYRGSVTLSTDNYISPCAHLVYVRQPCLCRKCCYINRKGDASRLLLLSTIAVSTRQMYSPPVQNAMGGANLHTPPSIFQHMMGQQSTSHQLGPWMHMPQVPPMSIPWSVPALQQPELVRFTGGATYEPVLHQKRKLEASDLLDT